MSRQLEINFIYEEESTKKDRRLRRDINWAKRLDDLFINVPDTPLDSLDSGTKSFKTGNHSIYQKPSA